ncbi:MAG: hypothetical protein ACYSXF_07615, partial [Planctomycetota bacterium]
MCWRGRDRHQTAFRKQHCAAPPWPAAAANVLALCCLAVPRAGAEPVPLAAGAGPALREAIQALILEGRAIHDGDRPMPSEADFAARFNKPIDETRLLETLADRVNRDSFLDAYCRWQLTSFCSTRPRLLDLDDRDFLRFLRRAPAMIENPRAEPKTLAAFEEARTAGRLSSHELRRLRHVNDQLEQRTAKARKLNEPADHFYEWVQEQLGDAGPRPRQWLILRCARTIAAGWPTRDIKTEMTRDFNEIATDRRFSAAQRHLVARQVRALAGLNRQSVNKVTFMADRSVRVTLSTSGVDKGDVERWAERLMGR